VIGRIYIMILKDIISGVNVISTTGSRDVEIKGVAYSSSDVSEGFCFVALRGANTDGNKFVSDALARGAAAVVTERADCNCGNAVKIVVSDAREAMARISCSFYGNPSSEMKLVGVTGTNGKTTTTYLLESIFLSNGMNPGVIGSIEYRYGGSRFEARHTTPESADLQKMLRDMRMIGINACAMEVSSHALSQKRAECTGFDAAVFTNLTPEHLDYHKGIEEYFEAKAVLFARLLETEGKKSAFAAINCDDEYGRRMVKKCATPVLKYGMGSGMDITCDKLKFNSDGIEMKVITPQGNFDCRSRLCGRFNAENILAAVSAASGLEIDLSAIAAGVESLSTVPGRFENVPNRRGILAIVDYAHTPDALENVLKNARAMLREGGRLISVFGCGGDRDYKKRPMMGKAAGSLSDVAIVTSDNPRTENPEKIIEDILPGLSSSASEFSGENGYLIIEDRREAIAKAAAIARSGDILVVAGKGHEDYQIIGDQKRHFDDREVLEEILSI